MRVPHARPLDDVLLKPRPPVAGFWIRRLEEMSASEYAYSVITPEPADARDGLKPVQRRIFSRWPRWACDPTGDTKSARVVGEAGPPSPAGDSAIYDALVRLAQPFTLRLPGRWPRQFWFSR